ncbi:MAG TPA: polysaccharide biosynthesis protein, partial [Methanoregulaceae archaeon]|nr:polysaccharide biosynthesis protein [Methanoregulaceae archaeon]
MIPFHEAMSEYRSQMEQGVIRQAYRGLMEYMMDLYRPDIIYHAAAYKHVPMMEDYPVESIQVNVLGTKILADL